MNVHDMKPEKHWHPDWRDALIRHLNDQAGRGGGGPPHPLLALQHVLAGRGLAKPPPPPPKKARARAKPENPHAS